MTMSPRPASYSQVEAARQLHLSVRQLQRLRRDHLIDCRMDGRHPIYTRTDLDRYLLHEQIRRPSE